MSAGSGAPLSQKIELPAAFHEVLGEYKKALALVRKELREVEKEAAEVMKTQGVVDSALQGKIHALRASRAHFEQAVENAATRRQEEMRQSLHEQRAGLAHGLIEKTGLRDSNVLTPVSALRTGVSALAEAPQTAAAVLRQAGATGLANQVGALAKSAPGLALTRVASFIGSPHVRAAVAAVSLASKVYSMETESIMAAAAATSANAADFFRLTGGPIAGKLLDHGSAGRAIRVHNELLAAKAKGAEALPAGVGEVVGAIFGFQTVAQIQEGEKYRAHAVKMEEARQRFGIDKSFDTSGMQRQAEILYRRRSVTLEHRAAQAGEVLKNMAMLGIPMFMQGGFRTDENARQEAMMQAREQAAKSEDARRTLEETQWNLGAQGAVRRVLENEKRRWLRAVEIDRAARFNSWSLT